MIKDPANAGELRDAALIPGSGRSPGEGHGNPLQYSGLENPLDGGDWLATVHGVSKSQTRLRDFTGKTITLTRWTFVSKVVPLLLNML